MTVQGPSSPTLRLVPATRAPKTGQPVNPVNRADRVRDRLELTTDYFKPQAAAKAQVESKAQPNAISQTLVAARVDAAPITPPASLTPAPPPGDMSPLLKDGPTEGVRSPNRRALTAYQPGQTPALSITRPAIDTYA